MPAVRRHRRLLALCGLSALVHLALLEWAAAPAGMAPAPAPGQPLAVALRLRLAPADTPRREDGRRQEASPAPVAATPPSMPPAQPPAAAPPQPAGSAGSADAVATRPAATRTPATTIGQPATAASTAAVAAPADAPSDAPPLIQMPTRYRVRMPEPVVITYTQTRQAAGTPPQALPAARLDWRSNGERYLLAMDGVLGRLRSAGGSGDAGVRPRSYAEEAGEAGDGGAKVRTTEFADGEVRFRDSGRSLPDSLGIQDRASLLMQLAGIGLGAPDQVQDAIEIVVAGSADAAVERYEVDGMETLATALGPIAAWHLAQPASPGRPRLEVWLAPARGWLPVQLRVTGVDGAVATQTVSAIAAQTAAPPPAG